MRRSIRVKKKSFVVRAGYEKYWVRYGSLMNFKSTLREIRVDFRQIRKEFLAFKTSALKANF